SGNAEGGTGSLGQLASNGTSGSNSKARAAGGNLAGVGGGVMFGGDVPLVQEESALGRNLAIVRVYDLLGQSFENRTMDSFMSHGTTILASLDVFPGMPTYSAIAAGQHDAAITSYLESMNQSAIHYRLSAIYFTFEHEANTPGHHTGLGTPAQ